MSTPERELTELGGTEDGAMAGPRRRAARISQADVFAAADALLVMGERPTIDRVRMKLGRGSPNTINDHLDAWWAKLGARLRDLPGQEFPQLPERVARSLQQLWNEALAGAHEALHATLFEREQSLLRREAALEEASLQLAGRERAATARASALEDSLTLAREQLAATNQRAQALENSVQERDGECARLRARLESLELKVSEARAKFDAASAAHQAERAQLQKHYTAVESRWMMEADSARQRAKDIAKEHQQQLKELRRRTEALQAEREELKVRLADTRSELKAANIVRTHLEEQLRRPSGDLPRQRKTLATPRKSVRGRAKKTSPKS